MIASIPLPLWPGKQKENHKLKMHSSSPRWAMWHIAVQLPTGQIARQGPESP